MSENHIVESYDNRDGYALCRSNHQEWQTDFFAVNATRTPSASPSGIGSWMIEDGTPDALPA